MKINLTTEQKIRNAAACQEVENLHARHCYMHCGGRNIEEIDNYWIHSDGVSWGHSFGKWTSWTGVKFGWGGSLERKGTSCFLQLSQVWPQVAGLDPRPLSEAAMHTLATDIIEVAADGASARAYFYTPGTISSTLNMNKEREGAWLWERYGIEYMRDENGEWKFYTIQVCPDIMAGFDAVNPSAMSYDMCLKGIVMPDADADDSQIPGGGGPNAPITDEPEHVHNSYSLTQTVQNPVPWPEPYESFDYDHSYRYRVEDWK